MPGPVILQKILAALRTTGAYGPARLDNFKTIGFVDPKLRLTLFVGESWTLLLAALKNEDGTKQVEEN